MDYANEHPSNEARTPIYANLLRRVANVNVGAKPFVMHSSTWYWSSTEYNSNGAWYVSFSSGYTGTYNKYYSSRVRPVAAFTFKL